MKKVIGQSKKHGATLRVHSDVRDRIKEHCKTNSLWVGKFVETVITDYLDSFYGVKKEYTDEEATIFAEGLIELLDDKISEKAIRETLNEYINKNGQ